MKESNQYSIPHGKWITNNQSQNKWIGIVGKSLDMDVNWRATLTKCRKTCGNLETGLQRKRWKNVLRWKRTGQVWTLLSYHSDNRVTKLKAVIKHRVLKDSPVSRDVFQVVDMSTYLKILELVNMSRKLNSSFTLKMQDHHLNCQEGETN